MHLREYLDRPESLSVSQLRRRINELGGDIQHDAQIRQWATPDEDGEFKRFPSPANAQLLHVATDGLITLQAMRPKDFGVIWPELCEKPA